MLCFSWFKRVFTTVVLSLGEFFGPDKSPHITCDYIIEVGIIIQILAYFHKENHTDGTTDNKFQVSYRCMMFSIY